MPSLLHASQGSLSLSPPHARAPHAAVQAQAVLPALGRATPTALPTHLEKVVTGWRGERGETRGRARREFFFFRRIGAPLAALPALTPALPSSSSRPHALLGLGHGWFAQGGRGALGCHGTRGACVCVRANKQRRRAGVCKRKVGERGAALAPPPDPQARARLSRTAPTLSISVSPPHSRPAARARGPPLAGTPCPCPPPQLGARTAKKRAANTAMRAPPSPFTAGNAGDPVTGQQSLPTDPRPAFAAALAGSRVDVVEPMALGWCVWLWSLVVVGGARRGAWLPKKSVPRAPHRVSASVKASGQRQEKAPSPPRPHPAPRQQGPPHDRDARQALSQCL